MNRANDGHIVTVAYEVTDLVDTEVAELTGRLWFLYVFDPEKVTPVGDDGSYTFRLHAIGWLAQNRLTHEEGEGITSDLDSVRTLDWSLGEVLYHELNYVQPRNIIEFPKPDPRFTYEENWEAIVEFLTSNTEYYVPPLDCICLSSSWG